MTWSFCFFAWRNRVAEFSKGTKISLKNGDKVSIVYKLGEGGQGIVYRVKYDNDEYALKWYFKNSSTNAQREIIEKLIARGVPSNQFLWPLMLAEENESFGYLMRLRPPEYKNVVDLMKRRTEPSFNSLIVACFNLAEGFKKLHSWGLCYCDVSFGNMFFHPEDGRILICDNDNVIVNKTKPPILGTAKFMAPEVVRGEEDPSTATDLYSMGILLFYMLMIHHPLEGKVEASIKALDVPAMNKLYGWEPVFIWDPENKCNRPVKGLHDNAIIFWDVYPKYIKNMFIQSFVDGIGSPKKRVVEKEWQDAFEKLASSIFECPSCKSEIFFDEEKVNSGSGHICWQCQENIHIPPRLKLNDLLIPLYVGKNIYRHNIYNDFDMNTICGVVIQNPRDPNILGIKNLTKSNWIYIKSDGSQSFVEPNKSAPISRNAKIEFENYIAEIIV